MTAVMGRSIIATWHFFSHLLRDLAGTLYLRWRRFRQRVVEGRDLLVVGVDIYPFLERMTGVGWYEWNLLKALDARDDDIFYNLYAHTFLAPDATPVESLPGQRSMRMRVHQIPAGFLLPVGPTLSLLRHTVEPLLRLLDGNDVLFAPNFFLRRSQLPFGKTAVATVHDLAFIVMPKTVAAETQHDLRSHLPETLFRCERLIAVSDATANDLSDHLGISRRRIHTIHEGLDPCFAAQENPGDLPEVPVPYLLFVSTIEPRKNVIGVLRAFRLLVEWGYQGSLVLVGRWGWHTDEIRRELAGSAVRSRIFHLDYVDRDKLPALYRKTDALLFPSWLEGFGLPVLEAMACGAPVVTSGLSAMPEVAGPAAVYIDPASPHSIASAVAALLEDPQHRLRLIEMGRKRAGRFSWERSAESTAQTLREAAGLVTTGDDEYRV
jgi:glycosyltransferase involved in cell wall biosynthesis